MDFVHLTVVCANWIMTTSRYKYIKFTLIGDTSSWSFPSSPLLSLPAPITIIYTHKSPLYNVLLQYFFHGLFQPQCCKEVGRVNAVWFDGIIKCCSVFLWDWITNFIENSSIQFISYMNNNIFSDSNQASIPCRSCRWWFWARTVKQGEKVKDKVNK